MTAVGKTRTMDDRYTAVIFTSRRRQDASAASDGAIPGLDPGEAETLRRLLLARSGAPLEGE